MLYRTTIKLLMAPVRDPLRGCWEDFVLVNRFMEGLVYARGVLGSWDTDDEPNRQKLLFS